ncbi:hypothetical protein CGC21_4595 [Leishmania donovani]|uniref:Uncharacterized protein n=1 Tax=Leishmania donovani TaxID=5661 RepID=A0A504XJD4_LEIDO|nr:hypothetical protein CGC21_4595 [Leishmania donovani]
MHNGHHRKIDGHLDSIEDYLRRMARPPRTRYDPPSLHQVPRTAFFLVSSSHEGGPSYQSANEQAGLQASTAYNMPPSCAGLLSTPASTLAAPRAMRDSTAVRTAAAHHADPASALFTGIRPPTSNDSSSSTSASETAHEKGTTPVSNSTAASSLLIPAVRPPPLASLEGAAAAREQAAVVSARRRSYGPRSPSPFASSQDKSRGRSMRAVLEGLEEHLRASPLLSRSPQQMDSDRHPGSSRHPHERSSVHPTSLPQWGITELPHYREDDSAARERAVHIMGDLATATSPMADDHLSSLLSSLGGSPNSCETPFRRRLRHLDHLLGDGAAHRDATSTPRSCYRHDDISALAGTYGSSEPRATRCRDPPAAEESLTKRRLLPAESRTATGTLAVPPIAQPTSMPSVFYANVPDEKPHLRRAYTARLETASGADVPTPSRLEAASGADVATPLRLEAASGADVPTPSRLEAASGVDVATPLRLETASGADVPTPSRLEAASGVDVATPLRLEAASGADVATPLRLEAASGADVATPLRLETASGADVPTPSRLEAASGVDVATPLRLETASGADVPTPSRLEAASGADVATPLRLEAASGADVPTPSRLEAASGVDVATPLRLETASGADVPTPSRLEAASGVDVATPLRLEAASGADVATPLRLEAASGADVATPLRLETASGADVPTPSRLEAASGVDVATPLRLETASGADVPTPSRLEAASGADVATPLRLETASGADVPTPSRLEAASGADVATPLRLETASGADVPTPSRLEAASGADVPTPSRLEAASGADVATPLRLETASGADVPTPSRLEAASGADVATPLRLETASGADVPTPSRLEAASGADVSTPARGGAEDNAAAGNLGLQDKVFVDASRLSRSLGVSDGSEGLPGAERHRGVDEANEAVGLDAEGDVLATLNTFRSADVHDSPIPSSLQQQEQLSVGSVSTELTALTVISIEGGLCGPSRSGRGDVSNEEDVSGGRCLATRLWARRQGARAAQQLLALRKRERQHRQSVVKREVEGRYAIRLREASDAADVGLEWLRGADEDTVTATSFTLSSSPSRLVRQLPHRVKDGSRSETVGSRRIDRLADDGATAEVSRYEGRSSGSGRTLSSSKSSMSVIDDAEQQRAFKRACPVGREAQALVPSFEVATGAAAEDAAMAERHDSPAASLTGAPGTAVCEVGQPGGTPAPEGAIARAGDERTQQQESDYAATTDLAVKPTAAAKEDVSPPSPHKLLSSHLKGALSCSVEAAADTPVDETVHAAAAAPQGDDVVSNAHIADAPMPRPPPSPLEGHSSPPSDLWTLDKGESEGDGGEEETEAMMTSEGHKRSSGNDEYEGSKHASGGSSSAGRSIPSGAGPLPARAAATAADNDAQPPSPSSGDKRISSSISSASSSSSVFIVQRIGAQPHLSPSASADASSTGTEGATVDVGHTDASSATAFKWVRASSAAAADDVAEYPPVAGAGMEHAQARTDAGVQANLEERGGSDGGAGSSRNAAGNEDDRGSGRSHSAGAAVFVDVQFLCEKDSAVDERAKKDGDVLRPSHLAPQPAEPSLPPYATARTSTDVPVPARGAATAMTTSPSVTTTTTPLSNDHGAQHSTAVRSPAPESITAHRHTDEEQPRSRRNARTTSSSGASSGSFFYSLPRQGTARAMSSDERREQQLLHQANTTGEITSPVHRRTEAAPAPHAWHQRPWEQPRTDEDTGSTAADVSFLREAWHGGCSFDVGGGIRPDDHSQRASTRGSMRGCSSGSRDSAEDAARHSAAVPAAPKQPAISWTIPLDWADSLDEMDSRYPSAAHAAPDASIVSSRQVCLSESIASLPEDPRQGSAPPPASPPTSWPSVGSPSDSWSPGTCADAGAQATSFTAVLSAVPRRSGPWYAIPAQGTKKEHHAAPVVLAKAAPRQPRRSVCKVSAAHNAEKARGFEEWTRPGAGTQSIDVLRESASSYATVNRSKVPTTTTYATPGRRWPAGFGVSPSPVRTRTLPPPPCSAASAATATGLQTRTASAPTYSAAEAARNTAESLLQLRRQRQPAGLTYVQLYERGRSLHLRAPASVWRPSSATRAVIAGGMRAWQAAPTPIREGVCGRDAASPRSAVVWRLTGAPRPRVTKEGRAVRQQEQWELPLISTPHEAVAARRLSEPSPYQPRRLSAAGIRGGMASDASSSAPTDAARQTEYAVESVRASNVVQAQSSPSLSGTPPSSSPFSLPPPPPTVATAPRHAAPTAPSMKNAAEEGAGDDDEACKPLEARDKAASTAHTSELAHGITSLGHVGFSATAAAGEEGATQGRDETEQGEENDGEGLLRTRSDAASRSALRVSAPTPAPSQSPQQPPGASLQRTPADVTPTAASTVADAEHHHAAKTTQLLPTPPGDEPEHGPQPQPLLPSPHALGPLQVVLSEEGEANAAGLVEPHAGSDDAAQLLSQQGPTEPFRGDQAATGKTERGHGFVLAVVGTAEMSHTVASNLGARTPGTAANPYGSIDAAGQGQDVGVRTSRAGTPVDQESLLSPDTDAALLSIFPAPPMASEVHAGHCTPSAPSPFSPATAVSAFTIASASGLATSADIRCQSGAQSTHQLSHLHVADESPAPLPQPAQLTPQPSPRAAEPRAGAASAADGNDRVISPPPKQQQRREVLENRIARLEATLMLQRQQRQQTELSRFRDHDHDKEVSADYFEAATDGDEDLLRSACGKGVELRRRNMQSSQPRGRGRSVDSVGGRSAVALSAKGRGASGQAQRSMLSAPQAQNHHLLAPASAIYWAARPGFCASGGARGTGAVRRRGLRDAAAPSAPHMDHGNRSGLAVALPSQEAVSASAAPGASIASYTRLAYRRYGSAAAFAVATPADPRYSHATTSFLISADWRYQRMYVDSMYFPEATAGSASRGAEAASEAHKEESSWLEATSGAPEDPANSESGRATPAAAVRRASSANNRDADVFVCRPLR